MLCGPPGSGKTMTLFSALRALPDMEVVGLNFSSATTPELLLKTFDHYCEYRKTPNGVVLAPVQVIINLKYCEVVKLICGVVTQKLARFGDCFVIPHGYISYYIISLSPGRGYANLLPTPTIISFKYYFSFQLGKWLVLFCDEINLPDMDQYGTQRVISFLRQLLEHKGFYRASGDYYCACGYFHLFA